RGELAGERITRLVLLDAAYGWQPSDGRVELILGDIADPALVERAVGPDTAAVFHLAAVVSGAAEADFDLGMRSNLDGTRLLLERLRRCAAPARLVFASSVAAFGGALPDVLDDSTTALPQTSYGTQKVIGEYLISDYSRKGYLDGRSLRLPTFVVRERHPARAAERPGLGMPGERRNRRLAAFSPARGRGLHPCAGIARVGMGREPGPESSRHHRLGARDAGCARACGRPEGGGARGFQARCAHPGDRADLAGALPHAARARHGVPARRAHGDGAARLHRGREHQ